jgi:hypothetical protein
MLQTQTVAPQLVELLNKIMSEKLFSDFYLVGGTALALQIGHRNSIDIDMFGQSEIDTDLFVEKLAEYGDVKIIQNSKNILITNINQVKVDFVIYKYPLVADTICESNIRMFSRKDIAAMKLNAIAGRGSKKDFIDLYFLMQEFSLKEMLSFYEKKYDAGSVFMVVKSLSYFDDADLQQQPQMFFDFDWENCKKTILHHLKLI